MNRTAAKISPTSASGPLWPLPDELRTDSSDGFDGDAQKNAWDSTPLRTLDLSQVVRP